MRPCPAAQERQEDHRFRPQRRLPQLHRGERRGVDCWFRSKGPRRRWYSRSVTVPPHAIIISFSVQNWLKLLLIISRRSFQGGQSRQRVPPRFVQGEEGAPAFLNYMFPSFGTVRRKWLKWNCRNSGYSISCFSQFSMKSWRLPLIVQVHRPKRFYIYSKLSACRFNSISMINSVDFFGFDKIDKISSCVPTRAILLKCPLLMFQSSEKRLC